MRTVIHHEKSIDWRKAMDQKKTVIVQVPKGEIGEEIAKLAGAIIVLNIKIAALGRKEGASTSTNANAPVAKWFPCRNLSVTICSRSGV
jgi:hypothetical protein